MAAASCLDAELTYDHNAFLQKRDQYFVCVEDGQLSVPLDKGLTKGDQWIFHYYEYEAFHPHRGDLVLGAFKHKDYCIYASDQTSVSLKIAPENFENPMDDYLFIVNDWDPCYLESAMYEGRYLHFDRTNGQLDLARKHERIERTESYDFHIQFTLISRGTKIQEKRGMTGYDGNTGNGPAARAKNKPCTAPQNRSSLTKTKMLGPEPCVISVFVPEAPY